MRPAAGPSRDTPESIRRPSRRSRRGFLAVALTVVSPIVTSCIGTSPPDNPPPAQPVPSASPFPTSTPRPGFSLPALPFIAAATPTPVPIELRFAHWEVGAAGAVLAAAVSQFQQSTPGARVHEDVSPFGTHFERLEAASASGTSPDVFVDSGAYYYDHLASGLPLDLAPLATVGGFDAARFWTDPVTQSASGQLRAVPLWCVAELVFVNLGALARKGVSLPTAAWSWDDLLALATKLTEGKAGEVRQWGTLFVNELPGGWGSFVASNGGSWIELPARKTSIDSAAVEALQWLVDAIHVHHVAPDPMEQQRLTRAGQIDPFVNGDIPLLLNGTWEMPDALTGARFQWDVLPLPRAPRTGMSVSLAATQPGCVAKQSAHPAEAWQFLRFLLRPEVQTAWSTGKVRLPSLRSVAADPTTGYASVPPGHSSFAAGALTSARDYQFTTRWQQFRAAVVGALAPAFVGRVLLADAVAQATSDGDTALGG